MVEGRVIQEFQFDMQISFRCGPLQDFLELVIPPGDFALTALRLLAIVRERFTKAFQTMTMAISDPQSMTDPLQCVGRGLPFVFSHPQYLERDPFRELVERAMKRLFIDAIAIIGVPNQMISRIDNHDCLGPQVGLFFEAFVFLEIA